jgi:thiamine-phosphate pyrophosphorylase
VSIAEELVKTARGSGSRCRVIVNDRVDVALAARADGVHLRADSPAPAVVRPMVPHGFLIGRSVHSGREAAAIGSTADYLIAGTIWPTSSKPLSHAVLGPDGLAEVVRNAIVPVLAIGGVTPERFAEVAGRGAAGVAGIGLFIGADAATDGCRAIRLDAVAASARAV